jgi:hypothetical protein
MISSSIDIPITFMLGLEKPSNREESMVPAAGISGEGGKCVKQSFEYRTSAATMSAQQTSMQSAAKVRNPALVSSYGNGPNVCTGCCSQMISGMFSEVAHMYPAC